MNERRKQFYTDQRIQGYLLAALIALEFVLIGILIFYFYSEINSIIEDRLYRVHRVDNSTWPEIFTLLAVSMGCFVVVNILVLILAHIIWGRYVRQTLALFSSTLDKIIDLDFSGSSSSIQHRHSIVDLIEQWFDKEQKRNRDITTHNECLSKYEGKPIGQDEIKDLEQILKTYRSLLADK